MFDTTLKYSFAFYPQIDCQIKVVNHYLINLLRCQVGGKLGNSYLVLPIAEFAYNNSVNRSTTKSHFEVVNGFLPRQPIDFVPLPIDYYPSDST